MQRSLLALTFGLCAFSLSAQTLTTEVVSSSGGTVSNATTVLDWTVGELAVTTLENNSQLITQGFHQLSVELTSTRELPREVGQIEVFPNPTADQLQATLEFVQPRLVDMRLLDINGRVVWTKQMRGSRLQSSQDVSHLPAGTYLLHVVIDGDEYSQTFRVQKIR
jgi:hypothetical protein